MPDRELERLRECALWLARLHGSPALIVLQCPPGCCGAGAADIPFVSLAADECEDVRRAAEEVVQPC